MQKKTHAVNPFYCGLTVHRYTEYSKKLTKRLRAALITDLHSTISVSYTHLTLPTTPYV